MNATDGMQIKWTLQDFRDFLIRQVNKADIKLMIQEELTKLADEAEDEDGEEDAEKDETQPAAPEVKA